MMNEKRHFIISSRIQLKTWMVLNGEASMSFSFTTQMCFSKSRSTDAGANLKLD